MFAPFTKMHGCGNDFVILDGRAAPLGLSAARAAAIADRQTGIGCDQLIVLERPANGADVFMRIRNPDGTEAGACGNATRCVASLLAIETGRRSVRIETSGGDLSAELDGAGEVSVDMGRPRLGWQDVPLAGPADTLHLDLDGDPAALSMGNPHATWFVDDVGGEDIARLGPRRERDALFPTGANIGFAQVLAPDRIRLRVWERGAGLTRACGSGACATAVNAARRGLTGRQVTILADGGAMLIRWREDDHVIMTGPSAVSFTGRIDLAGLPR